MKTHMFNSETGVTTRNKSVKKKELSPQQRRKIYKRDMKKREEKKLKEKIKQKQEIWNEEHLDSLEWDEEEHLEWDFRLLDLRFRNSRFIYDDDDDFCEICNVVVFPMIYTTGKPILCPGCEYHREEIEN